MPPQQFHFSFVVLLTAASHRAECYRLRDASCVTHEKLWQSFRRGPTTFGTVGRPRAQAAALQPMPKTARVVVAHCGSDVGTMALRLLKARDVDVVALAGSLEEETRTKINSCGCVTREGVVRDTCDVSYPRLETRVASKPLELRDALRGATARRPRGFLKSAPRRRRGVAATPRGRDAAEW